jgi:DNA-directed RNA polymerase sigma subunit (sigma70/sigma32)
MSISIEDLRRLIFHEKKTYEEIGKMYKISPNKVKELAKSCKGILDVVQIFDILKY